MAIRPLTRRFHHFRTSDAQQPAPQRALRFLFNLGWYCAKQMRRDQASQMAAALTYRTIFSLIPVLVLSMVVVKAFGGFEDLDVKLRHKALSYLGLSSISLEPQRSSAVWSVITPPDAQPQSSRRELAASVEKVIDQLTHQASGLSFGSIGAVGLALFIFAALALISTVEDCFNRIYGAEAGRSWRIRIPVYWAVMTLGPFLLAVTLYVTGQWVAWLHNQPLPFIGPVLVWLSRFTALASSSLLFFLLYTLLPNVKVTRSSALVGSVVAACLWEGGKVLFKLYVEYLRSSGGTYTVVYGSLALIPLFLFWIYLTWMIVLLGLEISNTLQGLHSGKFLEEELAQRKVHIWDPHVLIPIMVLAAGNFQQGLATDVEQIAGRLRLPRDLVQELIRRLRDAGLVHLLDRSEGEEALTLALPPQQVSVDRLLELSRDLLQEPEGDDLVGDIRRRIYQAQRDAVGERSLQSLLAPAAAPGAS